MRARMKHSALVVRAGFCSRARPVELQQEDRRMMILMANFLI